MPTSDSSDPSGSSKANEYAPTVYTVNAAERFALTNLAETVTADSRTHPDWFCRQARRASSQLPGRLASHLQTFGDTGSSSGFTVLKGHDVGEVPATPPNNKDAVGATTSLARQLAIFMSAIGDPIAYEAEGHAYLLQDMAPNKDLAMTQQSQGSKVDLEAHKEQAFSDLAPDYVALGCLVGDPDADTYVLDARTLIDQFDDAEVHQLRQPSWTLTIDESFKPYVPNPDEVRGPVPVITGAPWDPTMVIDQDLMRGVDAESQALLERVIAVYQEHRLAYTLEPGDILLLDNLRAMHGRSAFKARFDATDRFVVRGFIVRDRRRMWPYMKEDRRTVLAKHS
jgi:L-asparagine oxygenase